MNKGICKLCKLEKELLSKSHIIPRFLINNTVNKDKKGFVGILRGTTKSNSHFDTGYEKHILCNDCDNRLIGLYDDYACKFLYGSLGRNQILRGKSFQEYTYLENIDYNRLKYFCLSLLWRCSISSSSNFQLTKLIDSKQEELRQLILNQSKLSNDEYPVIIWSYGREKKIPKDLLLPPFLTEKKKGEQSFLFIGAGIMIQVRLSSRNISPIETEAMLKDIGIIKIPNIPYEGIAPLINKFVGFNWLK
ncbi:MAG: hypothetical protein WED10_09245 [Brumimicrobium sp.]